MKMNEELEKAVNKQMHEELASWYLYKAIEAWFTEQNLDGFAHWMHLQAEEELEHAERLRAYLVKRGNRVTYQVLNTPTANWQKSLDVITAAYQHEVYISKCIDLLTKEAMKQGDLGAIACLEWFVKEQEEEEESTLTIVHKLQMVGESTGNLYQLNKELKKRV